MSEIVIVVFCSGVFLAGVVGLIWQIVDYARSTVTVATITGYETRESHDRGGCSGGDFAYDPIVEFTAANGTHVRTVLAPSSEWCSPPKTGETVSVVYRDDAPAQIQDTKFGDLWWAIGAILFGGFFLFFSIGWLRHPDDPEREEYAETQ
ncbi:DUF3592 domain-containing protein [Microbacterium mangrovi]|uniref:DUF3592 domain-containing protein n=1 Tax=Microbacterium mangrovi TaxID=1348253 RepID=UPI0012E06EC2|nr:DUF3592 domain-containing protein [Microbacterium mangrovi]